MCLRQALREYTLTDTVRGRAQPGSISAGQTTDSGRRVQTTHPILDREEDTRGGGTDVAVCQPQAGLGQEAVESTGGVHRTAKERWCSPPRPCLHTESVPGVQDSLHYRTGTGEQSAPVHHTTECIIDVS